ncbi:glycosyltransferase [bacterium]|nr:glycosyltransferase [bacterium]
MAKPSVSVILNNYNYGAYLGHAIQSVLDQTSAPAEVIVVDDGSTDNSREVIAAFGDRIIPVLQDNAGQAAAINAGVERSTGEVLSFLDADDWWVPDKVATIGAAFAGNPDAGLVYHRLQPIRSDGTHAFRAIPRSLCAGDLAPRMARSGGRWPYPMTSAVSVRRRIWDRAGEIPRGFRISADAWLVSIHPFLAPVVGLPDVLGYYRIHANQWYRAEDDALMLQKRMAHWKATVDVTDRFLRLNGQPWRVLLADHHPYQVAAARLHGAGPGERLRLLWSGLSDVGEPNLLRRLRDTLREVRQVSGRGMADAAPLAQP